MIRLHRPSSTAWRHVLMTLAAFAIVLKVLIPPGFMAAAPTNDLPFAIVLCTSQGAVTVEAAGTLPSHDGGDKAPTKSAHDSPCAFAGHGAGAPPPASYETARAEFVTYRPAVRPTPPGLTPGRGLIGPPLPARGPPSLLI